MVAKKSAIVKFMNKLISLDQGAGGRQSAELIAQMRKVLKFTGKWKNTSDDAALFDLGNGQKLVFTTDAFIVDPIFFWGGDIGKISICGTINDLAVMGAVPLGISLSIVMEEGFPRSDLDKIIKSINTVSEQTGVPVVTGDTKVTEKGKLDKIEITTAGVGLIRGNAVIVNNGASPGDVVIASGDLGEHGVALLAHRFNYQTSLKSDCRPLITEIKSVKKYLTACKDPTRGGLAANINEIADKSKVKILLGEEVLPYKKEVLALADLLGIDPLALPSEGRFIATVPLRHSKIALKKLRGFNKTAKIIGTVERGRGVFMKTKLGGLKKIDMPSGKLIPRIC